MNTKPQYTNECYRCGFEWTSWCDDEECPECGEYDEVGTDLLEN